MSRRALAVLASGAAAYTPVPALELSDRSPAQAPAITSTLTQPQGQPATRTIGAAFPRAFTYNPDLAVTGCLPAAEQARACPAASRVGTMEARSPLGDAAGPVHLTEDLRLAGFLEAYAGLARWRVTGVIVVQDDGSPEVVFDDLPDLPVTSSRIALDGGDRGLLVTPRRCGTYRVRTRFVSHAGDAVAHTLPVRIEGCPPRLAVRRVRVAGRVLRWRVTAPATTRVGLLRRSPSGWREVRAWRRAGTALRLPPLPRGTYRAVLRAVAADGRASAARTVRFTVR